MNSIASELLSLADVRELASRQIISGSVVPSAESAEYRTVCTEIDRLNFGSSCDVQWPVVVAQCVTILSDQSKNLRIAAYLAYGLFEMDEADGLKKGLRLLSDLIEKSWDGLDPPLCRLRGRRLALSWYFARVTMALKSRDQSIMNKEIFDCLLSELDHLQKLLSERIPEVTDEIWSLRSTVEARMNARKTLPNQPPDEVLDEGHTGTSSTVRKVMASNEGLNLSDPSTRERHVEEVRKSLLSFSAELRKAAPFDARAYELSRAAIWLPLRDDPPAENGRTALPPPSSDIADGIMAAVAGNHHEKVLNLCEEAAADHLFWFDANCRSSQALSSLGHHDAAVVVKAEIIALLHRLPRLKYLKFSDGTPFASPQTLSWLGLSAEADAVETTQDVSFA